MQVYAFVTRHLWLWRLLIPLLVLALFIYAFEEMKYPMPIIADILLWISRMDPFLLIMYVGATWTIPSWVWLPVLVTLSAALAGRVFCGWICPLGGLLGVLQYGSQWVSNKIIPPKIARSMQNLAQYFEQAKYWWLLILLVTVQIGFSTLLLITPSTILSHELLRMLKGEIPWVITTALLLGLVFYPRFWCVSICPTGIIFSAAARLRSRKMYVGHGCTGCRRCERLCPIGTQFTKLEGVGESCLVCGTCWSECPQHAIHWNSECYQPRLTYRETRRRFLKASAGILVSSFFYLSAKGFSYYTPQISALRPPGALAESDFLATCNRCSRCIKVCPNDALVSLPISSGIGMYGTPEFVPRKGRCELCMLCGQVCPTGAIQRVKAEQARIGVAILDRGTCLVWKEKRLCLICKEQCPVNAVHLDESKRPHIDIRNCVGCGACENACPLETAAVKVIPNG